MKKTLFILLGAVAFTLLPCALLLNGCKTPTLDPAGVYQGDAVLYSADASADFAFDGFKKLVTWEYQHHEAIMNDFPVVRDQANYVRTNAPLWRDFYFLQRSNYVWLKSAAGAGDMNAAAQLPEAQQNLRTVAGELGTQITNSARIAGAVPSFPQIIPQN